MLLLDKLILQFAKLPRMGRRAANRIVISLLQDKTGKGRELAASLTEALDKISPCGVCGCLSENDPCEYCADASRGNGELCVVRDFSDVAVLEKAGVFHGRYHITGGLLSGADGITPDDLHIKTLPQRIRGENITEVIFALPNTLDGKTTQQYIMSALPPVDCSELASGLPLGGDLDYADDGTLTLAFGDRKRL